MFSEHFQIRPYIWIYCLLKLINTLHEGFNHQNQEESHKLAKQQTNVLVFY